MKVSLKSGFGCPRLIDVLLRDISWPLLLTRHSLTYVSGGRVMAKFLWIIYTYRLGSWKDL
jgi:hypothetical protein